MVLVQNMSRANLRQSNTFGSHGPKKYRRKTSAIEVEDSKGQIGTWQLLFKTVVLSTDLILTCGWSSKSRSDGHFC